MFYTVPKGEKMSDKMIKVPDNKGVVRKQAQELKDLLGATTMSEAIRRAVHRQRVLLEMQETSSFVEIIGGNPDGPILRMIM